MGNSCSSVDQDFNDRPYFVPKRGYNSIQPDEDSMDIVTDSCIEISLLQEKSDVLLSLSGVIYHPTNYDNLDFSFMDNRHMVILKIVTTINDGVQNLSDGNVIVRRPSINWGKFDVAQQVPEQLPSRLQQGVTTIYGILSEGSSLSSDVFLKGILVDEEVEFGTFISKDNFASDEDVMILHKQIKEWESTEILMMKLQKEMVPKEGKENKENKFNNLGQTTCFEEPSPKTNISARIIPSKKAQRGNLSNFPTGSPRLGTTGRVFSNNSLLLTSCEIPINKSSSYSYNIRGSSIPDKLLCSPNRKNRRDIPFDSQFGSPPVNSSNWCSANSLLDNENNKDENIYKPGSSQNKTREKDMFDSHRQQHLAFLRSSLQRSPSYSAFVSDCLGNTCLQSDYTQPRSRAYRFGENISDQQVTSKNCTVKKNPESRGEGNHWNVKGNTSSKNLVDKKAPKGTPVRSAFGLERQPFDDDTPFRQRAHTFSERVIEKKVTFDDSIDQKSRDSSFAGNRRNMKGTNLSETLLDEKTPKGSQIGSAIGQERDPFDDDAPFRRRAHTFSENLMDKKVTFVHSAEEGLRDSNFVGNRRNMKGNILSETLLDDKTPKGTPVGSAIGQERDPFDDDAPFRQRAHTFSENLTDKKVTFDDSTEQRSRTSSFGAKSRSNLRVPTHVRRAMLNQLASSKPSDGLVSSQKSVEYICSTSKGVTEISRITTSVGVSKVIEKSKPRQLRRCNTMPSSLEILQALI